MKPLFNKILVKIEKRFQDEITTESGIKFYKDPTFKPEENATIEGIVVAIPEHVDKLNGEEDFVHNVQVGDKLFFSYLVVTDEENNLIQHNGEQLWVVDYFNAIAIERNSEIIPVGSYVLIEPLEEEVVQSSILFIPEHVSKKEETKGKVFASNVLPKGTLVEYEAVGKFWNYINGKKLYCMYNSNILLTYEATI